MLKTFDEQQQQCNDLLAEGVQAMAKGDEETAGSALGQYFAKMQSCILEEKRLQEAGQDETILAGRGVRQLTKDERDYYQAFIGAAKSPDYRQAITNLSVALPKTIIDQVMDDVVKTHPLLGAIDFVNTTAVTSWIVNKGSKPLAQWGKLCDEIVKELEGELVSIDVTMAKLSAWIPVCNAMLDLGPEWLDRYVRAILTESIAFGLEEAIINGTGVDMPIGMDRDLDTPKTEGQPYQEKAAVAVADFSAKTLGAQLAKIAVDKAGMARSLARPALIINSLDYYSLIGPATQVLTVGGQYVNIMPYGIQVIASAQVPQGKAILGDLKNYFMGIGTAQSGRIEYSDEFRFLKDERVYKVKLYGNGLPKDNNSFMVLDISEVKPTLPKVATVADTPTV